MLPLFTEEKQRLELCVVLAPQQQLCVCGGGKRKAPGSCFLVPPLPKSPHLDVVAGTQEHLYTFTDFTLQQGKSHNMERRILCKSQGTKWHRHHKHLVLQKEIIQSQICTKTSD